MGTAQQYLLPSMEVAFLGASLFILRHVTWGSYALYEDLKRS